MRTWRMRALLAVVGVLFALPTATAQAALVEVEACDDATLTTPFQRWGDSASYKQAPGGDFEGDLAGWTLSGGARTVEGGEPWGVTGRVGSRALALPAGASAVTPATCVNAGAPTFRFFARSTGGFLPLLRADLLYRDGLFRIVAVPAGIVLPGSGLAAHAAHAHGLGGRGRRGRWRGAAGDPLHGHVGQLADRRRLRRSLLARLRLHGAAGGGRAALPPRRERLRRRWSAPRG